MAFVQVARGRQKGRIWDLVEGENVIGRSQCAVTINDPAVSRAHARLVTESCSGRWTVQDLGSTNGTRLNGKRLTGPAELRAGDEIRVGNTYLTFGGTLGRFESGFTLDETGDLISSAIVEAFTGDRDTALLALPDEGEKGAANLRLVFELVAEINSIFDRDLLVQRTLDWILRIFPAERGCIFMIDDDGDLSPQASIFNAGSAEKAPIPRSIINEVMEKEMGLVTANAMTDERFGFRESVVDLGTRSAVCVPLKGRERVEGIIYLDIDSVRHIYTIDQLRLLTAIGYHIALAVENVRLHESALQTERLAVVGETAAYLSHHIKNILQALGAGIDLVQLCLQTDDLPRAKNAWPLVRRNLRKINEIMLNMLAFSTEREPLLQKVDINRILQECLDLERPQAVERGVELRIDLKELPEIEADPVGLHQAFLNLINNAVDAVKQRTGLVSVASRFDDSSGNVLVTISDNGSGIAPEQLGNIFTPFFSLKGHKGTGLGLAVAQMMVEEHRGAITVESVVDGGTTFTVTLPAGEICGETMVDLD